MTVGLSDLSDPGWMETWVTQSSLILETLFFDAKSIQRWNHAQNDIAHENQFTFENVMNVGSQVGAPRILKDQRHGWSKISIFYLYLLVQKQSKRETINKMIDQMEIGAFLTKLCMLVVWKGVWGPGGE